MKEKNTNKRSGGSEPLSFKRGIYAAAFTSMACAGYSLATNDYSKALPAMLVALPSLGLGYLCGVVDVYSWATSEKDAVEHDDEQTPKEP